MKRLCFAAAAAGLLVTGRTEPVFPDVSGLSSQLEPPDPLTMLDGQKVASREQWFQQRRPELKALFQHYMYGWFPPPVQVRGVVTYTDARFFDGQATLKLVTLRLDAAGASPIDLLMVVPNRRAGPAPVFLGMNFNGNHTLVADPHVPLPSSWMPGHEPDASDHHAHKSSRGTQIHVWELEQSIQGGYAVATFYCGDVEPDTTNAVGGVRETIHQASASDDWGTIAAWAWGLQRAVDYLLTDVDIDGKHIALVGHSRLGKAAMLAGAFDDRIALVIPLQAGCGGTAPSRGTVGNPCNASTRPFRTGSAGSSRSSTLNPTGCPSTKTALSPCARRAPCSWARPSKTLGPIRRALSTCSSPPTKSIVSWAPTAWPCKTCPKRTDLLTAISASSFGRENIR